MNKSKKLATKNSLNKSKKSANRNDKLKKKKQLLDIIVQIVQNNPEKLELYEDLLEYINLDIYLGDYNITICETDTGINSLYYSFTKQINYYLENNVYKKLQR